MLVTHGRVRGEVVVGVGLDSRMGVVDVRSARQWEVISC